MVHSQIHMITRHNGKMLVASEMSEVSHLHPLGKSSARNEILGDYAQWRAKHHHCYRIEQQKLKRNEYVEPNNVPHTQKERERNKGTPN